ncbi:hypothetical protein JZ751_029627, partial [Albula glossodonta]
PVSWVRVWASHDFRRAQSVGLGRCLYAAEYNGKTFGSRDSFKNLALKDAGLYFCEVWSEGSNEHARDSVNLSVAAKPSDMDLTSMEANSLSFQSSGWFPRPSVHWTDERNQDWTDSAVINIIKGKDGLYNIQTVLQTNRTLHRAKLHLSYINPYTGEEQTDVLLEKPILFCPVPSKIFYDQEQE